MRLPYPTENRRPTLRPVPLGASDRLAKTVPRPPGSQAAIGLVTAPFLSSGEEGDWRSSMS